MKARRGDREKLIHAYNELLDHYNNVLTSPITREFKWRYAQAIRLEERHFWFNKNQDYKKCIFMGLEHSIQEHMGFKVIHGYVRVGTNNASAFFSLPVDARLKIKRISSTEAEINIRFVSHKQVKGGGRAQIHHPHIELEESGEVLKSSLIQDAINLTMQKALVRLEEKTKKDYQNLDKEDFHAYERIFTYLKELGIRLQSIYRTIMYIEMQKHIKLISPAQWLAWAHDAPYYNNSYNYLPPRYKKIYNTSHGLYIERAFNDNSHDLLSMPQSDIAVPPKFSKKLGHLKVPKHPGKNASENEILKWNKDFLRRVNSQSIRGYAKMILLGEDIKPPNVGIP